MNEIVKKFSLFSDSEVDELYSEVNGLEDNESTVKENCIITKKGDTYTVKDLDSNQEAKLEIEDEDLVIVGNEDETTGSKSYNDNQQSIEAKLDKVVNALELLVSKLSKDDKSFSEKDDQESLFKEFLSNYPKLSKLKGKIEISKSDISTLTNFKEAIATEYKDAYEVTKELFKLADKRGLSVKDLDQKAAIVKGFDKYLSSTSKSFSEKDGSNKYAIGWINKSPETYEKYENHPKVKLEDLLMIYAEGISYDEFEGDYEDLASAIAYNHLDNVHVAGFDESKLSSDHTKYVWAVWDNGKLSKGNWYPGKKIYGVFKSEKNAINFSKGNKDLKVVKCISLRGLNKSKDLISDSKTFSSVKVDPVVNGIIQLTIKEVVHGVTPESSKELISLIKKYESNSGELADLDLEFENTELLSVTTPNAEEIQDKLLKEGIIVYREDDTIYSLKSGFEVDPFTKKISTFIDPSDSVIKTQKVSEKDLSKLTIYKLKDKSFGDSEDDSKEFKLSVGDKKFLIVNDVVVEVEVSNIDKLSEGLVSVKAPDGNHEVKVEDLRDEKPNSYSDMEVTIKTGDVASTSVFGKTITGKVISVSNGKVKIDTSGISDAPDYIEIPLSKVGKPTPEKVEVEDGKVFSDEPSSMLNKALNPIKRNTPGIIEEDDEKEKEDEKENPSFIDPDKEKVKVFSDSEETGSTRIARLLTKKFN